MGATNWYGHRPDLIANRTRETLMSETIRTQRIYFDLEDDSNDGNGWNVVDHGEAGGVASRFPSASRAVAHAMEIGAEFYLDSEPDPNDLVYANGEWVAPRNGDAK